MVRDDRVECLRLQKTASNVTWGVAAVWYVASILQAALKSDISQGLRDLSKQGMMFRSIVEDEHLDHMRLISLATIQS